MRESLACLALITSCSSPVDEKGAPVIIATGDVAQTVRDTGMDGQVATDRDGGPTLDASVQEPTRRTCMPGCTTPSDCSTTPSLYECLEGICSYVGCAQDPTACQDGYGCVLSELTPWRGDCALECTQQADCGDASTSCVDGYCRYVGCPDDAYCAARGDEYDVCRSSEGAADFCADSCTNDNECDPDFPADTVCGDEGWCIVAECESDTQCSEWWGWENPRCVRWNHKERRLDD